MSRARGLAVVGWRAGASGVWEACGGGVASPGWASGGGWTARVSARKPRAGPEQTARGGQWGIGLPAAGGRRRTGNMLRSGANEDWAICRISPPGGSPFWHRWR